MPSDAVVKRCRVEGCERNRVGRKSLCSMHSARLQRSGDVGSPEPKILVGDHIARFLTRVDIRVNGCWLWVGRVDRDGYGAFSVDTRPVKAHRFSYSTFVGAIPDGLQIDHLCRVRHCVRPEHLEPVTLQENLRRGREAMQL